MKRFSDFKAFKINKANRPMPTQEENNPFYILLKLLILKI